MRFFRLTKNKEIDNSKLTLDELKDKFTEEATEVIEAFAHYRNEPKRKLLFNLLTELLDVIQIVITIITAIRSRDENYTDEMCNAKISHQDKLRIRGWETKGYYEVKLYEQDEEK